MDKLKILSYSILKKLPSQVDLFNLKKRHFANKYLTLRPDYVWNSRCDRINRL